MGSGSSSSLEPPGRRRTKKRSKRKREAFERSPRALDPQTLLRNRDVIPALTGIENESDQVKRAISTGKLSTLPRLHTRPINVVVFHGSVKSNLEGGFPLRCFQRLSRPCKATLLRGWRHDRSTRGMFNPVLSY